MDKQNHNTGKTKARERFFSTEFEEDSGISENTRERAKTDKNQQYAITKTNYFTIFQHITKRTTNNANIKNNKERKQHNPTPANSITNSHTTNYTTTDYHTALPTRKETPETKN